MGVEIEQTSRGIGTRKQMRVLNTLNYGGVSIEILEYQKLLATQDLNTVSVLWFMEQQNVKVRQIAVYITNDAVRVEAGAMSYFQGPLSMTAGVTLGNVVGKMFKGAVTGESMSQPVYSGSGMLVLEPSFKHFIPFVLEEGECVIVDKGMFYMASESVHVEAVMQRTASAALFGGEGLFQIALTGPGLVVCESSVPMDEIDVINLNNDILRVDGNFAVLRTGTLDFTVERAAQTLVGSAVSGEGLVNVFRGTGQVWVAPTLKVYNMLATGQSDLRSMNMNTSRG